MVHEFTDSNALQSWASTYGLLGEPDVREHLLTLRYEELELDFTTPIPVDLIPHAQDQIDQIWECLDQDQVGLPQDSPNDDDQEASKGIYFFFFYFYEDNSITIDFIFLI